MLLLYIDKSFFKKEVRRKKKEERRKQSKDKKTRQAVLLLGNVQCVMWYIKYNYSKMESVVVNQF